MGLPLIDRRNASPAHSACRRPSKEPGRTYRGPLARQGLHFAVAAMRVDAASTRRVAVPDAAGSLRDQPGRASGKQGPGERLALMAAIVDNVRPIVSARSSISVSSSPSMVARSISVSSSL